MRVDKFHPIHLREEASRIVERRDKLTSQADVGEIGHPDDIRSIRCSTVEEIGRDREVVMRIRRVNNMPFQMTQQGPFTPDPEHMLMVDLPSISL